MTTTHSISPSTTITLTKSKQIKKIHALTAIFNQPGTSQPEHYLELSHNPVTNEITVFHCQNSACLGKLTIDLNDKL